LPCSRRPPLSSLVPVPEWGDVPGWLQAAGEAGALYLAVRGRRQAQAVDWARTLKELSGLSEEELRRLVEDNPVIAEIVGRAWEAAAETASDDKRRLLAKVAAAAIRGDAAAEVDELQLLAISQHGGSPEQITASWPSRPELFRPAVAALDRAGLVAQTPENFGGPAWEWHIGSYGDRFLAFLQETGEVEPAS
jgi:hypothetical protein